MDGERDISQDILLSVEFIDVTESNHLKRETGCRILDVGFFPKSSICFFDFIEYRESRIKYLLFIIIF
jgi:hypothetical protein